LRKCVVELDCLAKMRNAFFQFVVLQSGLAFLEFRAGIFRNCKVQQQKRREFLDVRQGETDPLSGFKFQSDIGLQGVDKIDFNGSFLVAKLLYSNDIPSCTARHKSAPACSFRRAVDDRTPSRNFQAKMDASRSRVSVRIADLHDNFGIPAGTRPEGIPAWDQEGEG